MELKSNFIFLKFQEIRFTNYNEIEIAKKKKQNVFCLILMFFNHTIFVNEKTVKNIGKKMRNKNNQKLY